MIKIYHNPRCSKSRACVAFAVENQKDIQTVDYMRNPPKPEELSQILAMLNMDPIEIVRTKEPLWQDKFAGQNLTDDELIVTMCNYPILIERPIVITDNRAFIARDPERFREI